ncbi:hypothetical protein NC653_015435 [Populus alba x Populus x berolinensis]|uniref:Uncharacterized protein n=1 Tax=Populus alba x Populus x berolinensis TaxID=444605 RepID=A0AAD6QKQ2_9ROSI|nr:hypothetical protein NC653_015435 [Populus alba x Populus x berolinensis]
MATVIIKRLAPSPFALITVLVTLAAFFFSSTFPFKPINTSPQQQELVWCNDGFPRLVQRPQEIALTEKMIACFKEDQVSHPRLEVYEGCDHLAEKCRV